MKSIIRSPFLGRMLRGCLSTAVALSALCVSTVAHATDADGDGVPDSSDAFPCDPSAYAVAYAPAQGQNGMLLFEDMWPSNGDLDFNDAVVTYNYTFLLGKSPSSESGVAAIQAAINVLAKGASLSSGLALHLPVPKDGVASIALNFDDGSFQTLSPESDESDLVIPLVSDLATLFDSTSFVNTTSDVPSKAGRAMNLLVRFKTPVAVDLSQAPFDLFIFRSDDKTHQIHRPEYAGTDTMNTALFGTADDGSTDSRHFVNKQGLPFVLDVPSSVLWPDEYMSIDTVYPDISAFAESGGTDHTDYYLTDIQTDKLWTGGADGSQPPIPVSIGPGFPGADTSCVAWKGTVEFGSSAEDIAYDDASDGNGNVFVTGFTLGAIPSPTRSTAAARISGVTSTRT